MNSDEFLPEDLLKEKRLWHIYLASRSIPHSRFNIISTLIVSLCITASACLSPQPVDKTIEIIRYFSSMGLSLSLNILGFLLAGFTIFATVSQPNLLLGMAEMKHPESGLSWLKHNFFIFMRVFIYYLAFAVFCLFIIIFGHPGGLLTLLTLVSLSPYNECIKFLVVKLCYIVLFTGYFFLILQLKSFIFNIYHSVMTSLRWKAEGYDE